MRKLFIADIKLLLRNKQLIFWSFAFPLIFAVLFGFFFSGNGSSAGTVAYVDKAHTQLSEGLHDMLKDQKAVTLQDESSEDSIAGLIKDGKAVAGVVIPADFGAAGGSTQVKVIYDPGSASGRATVDGLVGAYLTQASFQVQNVKPVFSINEVSAGTTEHGYFDYILVGLLGMALMNSAIQGLAISMSHYREQQILKRITTTPLSLGQFMLAEVASRILINMLQVGVILLVGIKGFHASIPSEVILPLFGLALVGAILFQLIGFSIATLSKTTDAAQGMAQAVTIPMMFLGGVFFPADGLPVWLKDIVQFLPLAPLLRVMRGIALSGASVLDSPGDIAIILGWIVVLAVFVRMRFRLAEE